MIFILAIVFIILLVVVGGDRGVVSLLSLFGNMIILGLAVILMSAEINPILITIAACIVINIITLFYQNGKSEKTTAAFISVLVIVAALILFVFLIGGRAQISGLNEIEQKSDYALYYSFNIHINMHLISICLIIIGLIGAIMDTAMAITSAVYEVHQHNPALTSQELRHSGIMIGKDILGTTLNTLYFAYIGEALMFMIYLHQYQYSLVKMINSKAFCADLISILFSALGCIMIIPLSAFVMSSIVKNNI